MSDWLIVLLFLGEVAALARLDRMVFGTWYTPFTLLAVPYAFVMLGAFLFAPALGFIPLYTDSVLVWAVGVALVWLGGLIVGMSLGKPIRARTAAHRPFLYEGESERLAILLAWLFIPIIVQHFFSSLRSVGGLTGLGTENFEYAYGGGLGAHLLVYSSLIFILLLGTVRRGSRIAVVTLVALAVVILARQVKYSLILPLAAGVLYRVVTGRTKLSVGRIAALAVTVYVVFNLAYLIGFWSVDKGIFFRPDAYGWLLHHFVAYIMGGVLVLGQYVHDGIGTVPGDPAVTFAPFVNLFRFLTAGPLVPLGNEYAAPLAANGLEPANVTTLFGPLLIGLGVWGAAVYALGVGLFSYCTFALAMLTRNCWAAVLWFFVASMLAFSFYVSYFGLWVSVEAPLWCLLVACVLWLARRSVGTAGPAPAAVGAP